MSLNILLTGATGALGPHLAGELLARPEVARLDALVRAGRTPASERFAQWAMDLPMPDAARQLEIQRLRLAAGDVEQDGLGLEGAASRDLQRETDVIVHAAADTRFLGPAEVQQDVNVNGTRRLLEFAAQCPRLRQVILVSTICVAGSSTGLIPEAIFTPPSFVNRYERTKWEAEQVAMASGLPVKLARVSIVLGSHETGKVYRLGALHHAMRWFGRGLIPLMPARQDTVVDLIAVETAAKFLAKAAVSQTPHGAIWHVAAGQQAVPLQELVELGWEQFRTYLPAEPRTLRPPQIVDAHLFERARQRIVLGQDPVLSTLMESVDTFLPGLQYPRIFDTRAAEAVWGGPLPLPDWRQTVARVIRFLCQSNSGRSMRLVTRSIKQEWAKALAG